MTDDARSIPLSPSPPSDGHIPRLKPDEASIADDTHADGGSMYPGDDPNVEGDENEGEIESGEVQASSDVGPAEDVDNRPQAALFQKAPAADAFAEPNLAHPMGADENLEPPDGSMESANPPPTPSAKPPVREPAAQSSIPPLNGRVDSSSVPFASSARNSPVPTAHHRSLTISKGPAVSVVLISSALEAIAASKEAKRSAPLRDSTHRALEMIRSNQAGDRPREIFEPLRLACETRNERLMIASLDCISKLISYSFFAESAPHPSAVIPSPPPSPHHSNRNSGANISHSTISQPSLVDLVAHTITSCHTETTPETVSLQIVKALLSLVLSPTVLVHHSSLLKAVRTVYNVFLLSTDTVNQMVAQGGLTQIVHHVFTRCRTGPTSSNDPALPSPNSQESPSSSAHSSFAMPTSSIPFANDRFGDVELSSEHEMLPSLPLPSDRVDSHGGVPEVTTNSRDRKASDESPAAQSQITLCVVHKLSLRDYTQSFCSQTVL